MGCEGEEIFAETNDQKLLLRIVIYSVESIFFFCLKCEESEAAAEEEALTATINLTCLVVFFFFFQTRKDKRNGEIVGGGFRELGKRRRLPATTIRPGTELQRSFVWKEKFYFVLLSAKEQRHVFFVFCFSVHLQAKRFKCKWDQERYFLLSSKQV